MRSFLKDEATLSRRLAAINRRMSSSLDFGESLRLIPRSATELLGGVACLLLSDETEVLRVRACAGMDPTAAAGYSGQFQESTLRELPQALGLPGDLHVAAAPVIADRGIQGILALLRATPLDAEGRWLLCALADQAAVTLRNAYLHEQAVAHERRLEKEVEHARRLSGELDELIHTVAHDLRAPLRTMTGCGELLLEEYAGKLTDERGRDYLERISAGARRMDALIHDLLAYTHLARSAIDLETLSLDASVQAALADLAPEVKASGAQVRVEVASVAVLGHSISLRMTILNLLSNAIKFVPLGETPSVMIHSESREGFVRLWVEDNGIGIDPAQARRIFGLFERLNRVEAYPGTGMGLALVRKAIERMEGRCGVDSHPGRGSRFWIELRRAGAP